MPSQALLGSLKQESIEQEPFEDIGQFFAVAGSHPPENGVFPSVDYDCSCQPSVFSHYQTVTSSRTPGQVSEALYQAPMQMANQQPFFDPTPYRHPSSDCDWTCPRSLVGLRSGQLSDASSPVGYQLSSQTQSFCFSDQMHQEPEPEPEPNTLEVMSPQYNPLTIHSTVFPAHISQSLPRGSLVEGCVKETYDAAPRCNVGKPAHEREDRNEDKNEPYAQLIFKALLGAPNHTMVLRDIYIWFQRFTDKPKESINGKGWQNSIRHNLSMNGAFEKVEQAAGEDLKKSNRWRLTHNAIQEGVKSTTRYRKHHQQKRGLKSHHNPHHRPSAQRQAAGARGGDATKRSSERKQVQQLRPSRKPTRQDNYGHALGLAPSRIVHPELDPCPSYPLASEHMPAT